MEHDIDPDFDLSATKIFTLSLNPDQPFILLSRYHFVIFYN